MKKLILLSAVLALFACKKESTKLYSGNTPQCNTPELLGKELVAAISEGSVDHYMNLTSSLADLHLMMDNQAAMYGANLEAAKTQFAIEYKEKIAPALKNSFLGIRKKRNDNNINWNEISFKAIELLGTPNEKLAIDVIPMNILFSYNNKTYRIATEKAIHFNNKWAISGLTEVK